MSFIAKALTITIEINKMKKLLSTPTKGAESVFHRTKGLIPLFAVLILSIAICGIANAQLTDSLQACYSFTGNATDETGNGYNATVVNATLTADRFSSPNKAYAYDGTTNYINLPGNSFLNTEYSYSVWVKTNSIPSFGGSSYVISVGSTSGDQAISLQNNSNWIGWSASSYYNPGVATQSVTWVLPTTNTWYHLVQVRDNSTLKLYVNGQLIASTPLVGTPYYGSDLTKKAVIGDRFYANNWKFDGVIDDIRIYNRALTNADVNSVYSSGEILSCAGFASVNENSISNDVTLYPNPSSGIFSIKSEYEISSIEIVNLLGEKVYPPAERAGSTSVNSNQETVNLSSQPNGVYFVKIKTNEDVAVKKIVKE